jgi:hypothetical protein
MGRHANDRPANGSASGAQPGRRPRLHRSAVELPPRLLGWLVSQPTDGWRPSSAWNAPLTIASLPTLIAGGDFIVGEVSTLGTVAELGSTAYDDHAVGEHEPAQIAQHPRRCLADGTLIAGLGGHLVDSGQEHPRLEVCVYRYRHLPQELRTRIDERTARRPRRWRRSRSNPAHAPEIRWAEDWFLADGSCITELLAADPQHARDDHRG